MTHEEFAERAIKELADDVRAKIKGGTIYGIPVDMENPDHLIAATYAIGAFPIFDDKTGLPIK
jgi:hypothetical protein